MTDIDTEPQNRRTAPGPVSRAGAATAMIAAPLFLLIGTALMPAALGDRAGTDRAKALTLLTDAAPDRSRIPAAVILVGVGLGLLVVTAVALAAASGGGRLAVLGIALVTVGAPMGAAANVLSGMTLYRLTDTDLSRQSAGQVLAWSSGPAGASLFVLYLLVLPGVILLAIAIGRSHALPWWNAGLIGAGAIIGFAAPEGPVGAAATLPLLAGMTLAARTLTAAPLGGSRPSGSSDLEVAARPTIPQRTPFVTTPHLQRRRRP